MNTLLIIVGILAVIGATYAVLLYTGKIKDRDGDFIPDVVEDTVEDIKEDVAEVKAEVKRRVKRVKEELKDVKRAGKNLAKQSKDVVEAVKGGKRKGRKPVVNMPTPTNMGSPKKRKTSTKK